jgi:hypothetical protein
MKGKAIWLLLLLAAPSTLLAGERLIPAGSLISCTVAEPRLSSRTANIGDPVLCQVGHVEVFGRSTLPYGSYLVGHFEDYKDPGHFVGKGWMELKFDRMIVEPDTVIPIDARVVAVPGYNVDREGRILGRGHAVRDAVLWTIPLLWPIDLIELPRRGPRPTLKEETRLTLKVLDDFGVPQAEPAPPAPQSPALLRREDYPAPPPQPAMIERVMQPVYVMPPPPVYYYAPPIPVIYYGAPRRLYYRPY